MSVTGGSIESISLAGREFPVTADAEVQRKLGGFENEVQSNGDGSARLIKTRVPSSLSGVSIEIDDDRGDQEFLQSLADSNSFFPVGVTFASGAVYQGVMQVVGEMQCSSQSATASFDLMGQGKLTKQ